MLSSELPKPTIAPIYGRVLACGLVAVTSNALPSLVAAKVTCSAADASVVRPLSPHWLYCWAR
jgi:hypothetical protein